jgi:hypothetical protein
MSPLVSLLWHHPLASYFALTLGVVWATAPLALASPVGHGLLNAFTPALVAVLITAASASASALLAAFVVAVAGPDLGVRRAAEGALAAGAPVSS